MSQSQLFVKTLKQLLKEKQLTYHMVAKHLKLSEASVKRMFALSQFSLKRIDEICVLLGMEISDLLQKMQGLTKRFSQLSRQQEEKIVSNRKLCLITICVVNHWSLEEILDFYHLDKHECIRCLAELDKLKLIELLPKNKIKLLITPNFSWISNGPIQQFFQKHILVDYLNSNFQNKTEEMIFQFGMLTEESNALFRKKLRHLADEFMMMSQQDVNESLEKRFGSVCFLMTKPWATTLFNEFIKKSKKSS